MNSNELDKIVKNNLLCGILFTFFINFILGIVIIILNEFKLKPAIKDEDEEKIKSIQKIIKIIIRITFVLALINFIVVGFIFIEELI